MQILECKNIKKQMISKLKEEQENNITLAIIKIGNFLENDIYLKSKKKLALELGVKIIELYYDENNSKEEIISKILELNNDFRITGIMIQKPILDKFNYRELANFIDYRKDIDGVGEVNQTRLENNLECIIPCTVRAILKVFSFYNISYNNKKIVIVGKSDLVGKPLYQILKKDNRVTLCDSKTSNLRDITRNADIVIIAIGKPNYFTGDYFKENQVIIDVGTNYLNGKLVGDVDFDSVKDLKSISITPVPGGVGQLTPIYLFNNLYDTKKIIK